MTPFRRANLVAVEVSIRECVHYGAFRYGHEEYHPYETYLHRLHMGESLGHVRSQFVDFLRHYRPRHLGEALGITLPRKHRLWLFPWHPLWKLLTTRCSSGWYRSPKSVPDIITSFCPAGIPRALLEKEYLWLHGAYESIVANGYLPYRFGHPLGRLFVGACGKRACLLLDGNHRVSALSALGYDKLVVEISSRHTVRLDELEQWPGVRARVFTRDEAESVFMAYFSGNHRYRNAEGHVPILD